MACTIKECYFYQNDFDPALPSHFKKCARQDHKIGAGLFGIGGTTMADEVQKINGILNKFGVIELNPNNPTSDDQNQEFSKWMGYLSDHTRALGTTCSLAERINFQFRLGHKHVVSEIIKKYKMSLQ